jgi:hypothetical protein
MFAYSVAAWFETRGVAALLTMRVSEQVHPEGSRSLIPA